jgi:hypothetical protein
MAKFEKGSGNERRGKADKDKTDGKGPDGGRKPKGLGKSDKTDVKGFKKGGKVCR